MRRLDAQVLQYREDVVCRQSGHNLVRTATSVNSLSQGHHWRRARPGPIDDDEANAMSSRKRIWLSVPARLVLPRLDTPCGAANHLEHPDGGTKSTGMPSGSPISAYDTLTPVRGHSGSLRLNLKSARYACGSVSGVGFSYAEGVGVEEGGEEVRASREEEEVEGAAMVATVAEDGGMGDVNIVDALHSRFTV